MSTKKLSQFGFHKHFKHGDAIWDDSQNTREESLQPFFKRSLTQAFFQTAGKVPEEMERLKRKVKRSMHSLSNFEGRWSSGLCLLRRVDTARMISSLMIALKSAGRQFEGALEKLGRSKSGAVL